MYERHPGRRQALLGRRQFVLIGLGMAVVLALVFPRGGALVVGAPDELSAAYLRTQLRLRPQDLPLRLRLAGQLRTLGRRAEARATLAPALGGGAAAGPARLLALELDLAEAQALPEGAPARRGALARLGEEARALAGEPLPPGDAAALADRALALDRPDVAALLCERLAGTDPPARSAWLARAARHHLESGRPDRAAPLHAALAALERDPPRRREHARLALDAWVAADQGPRAIAEARRFLADLPAAPELLATAVRLALAQGRLAEARRWGRTLLSLRPDDRRQIERQLEMELAAEDLPAALVLIRRLLGLQGPDPHLAEQEARLAEWARRPAAALRSWARLARSHPAASFVDHAIRLAGGLRQDRLLAEMLALKARRGPLSGAALAALAEAYERCGDPEGAAAALGAYRTRHPDQEDAWRVLSAVQERQGDLDAAIGTLTALRARLGGGLRDAAPLATLYLQAGRSAEALALLRAAAKGDGAEDSGALRLRADLAWTEAAATEALAAYRALWRRGAGDPVVAERIFELTRSAGRAREAAAAAQEGWRRLGEPRLLLLAMDALLGIEDWAGLGRLVALAQGREALFADDKRYWIVRARVSSHGARMDRARAEYERALALDPDFGPARSGLLWVLIEQRDPAALERHLEGWAAVARDDAALWRPCAIALDHLGRTREALAFFALEARRQPADPPGRPCSRRRSSARA